MSKPYRAQFRVEEVRANDVSHSRDVIGSIVKLCLAMCNNVIRLEFEFGVPVVAICIAFVQL